MKDKNQKKNSATQALFQQINKFKVDIDRTVFQKTIEEKQKLKLLKAAYKKQSTNESTLY